jgi:hypothetical protein
MAWADDMHGMQFKPSEVKLYVSSHSWGMKLSQLGKQNGTVRIITYSLPDLDYIKEQFARRPENIWIIAHDKFTDRAKSIKELYPAIRVSVRPDVHAKLLMIEPATIYVTSANFGNSHWKEIGVGVRSAEGHKWYLDQMFNPLWQTATEVTGKN